MKRPGHRLKKFVFGLCGIVVLLSLVGGLAFVTGRAHPQGGTAYKVIGTAMIVAAILVLSVTVRWWAKWFFAICFLTAVKAFFAVVFGYTVSQPRLVVGRGLAVSVLAVILGMLLLSYRYVLRPPHSAMESVGLIGALVGLSAGVLTEPNLWPLFGGLIFLGLPWLAEEAARVRQQ